MVSALAGKLATEVRHIARQTCLNSLEGSSVDSLAQSVYDVRSLRRDPYLTIITKPVSEVGTL